jgi:hypothetical protein
MKCTEPIKMIDWNVEPQTLHSATMKVITIHKKIVELECLLNKIKLQASLHNPNHYLPYLEGLLSNYQVFFHLTNNHLLDLHFKDNLLSSWYRLSLRIKWEFQKLTLLGLHWKS